VQTLSIDPGMVPGKIATSAGAVPRVTTFWTWRDRLGACKVRLNIGRMSYGVPPGLYAVGQPGPESPVFATANYKLTFDHLRRELAGMDAWILVLDTHAVNVWCAAGKGTFSTAELVRRVRAVQLDRVVTHRYVILPQLCAPGVDAAQASRECGFRIAFGPVYACDIPRFLKDGDDLPPECRRVRFAWRDRLAVAPLELVVHGKGMLAVGLALALLMGVGPHGVALSAVPARGLPVLGLWLATYALAGFLGPLLLPWLPMQAFSIKGAFLGVALALGGGLFFCAGWTTLRLAAWLLLIGAGASFLLLNFTGCTTFTSPSGVRREVRVALPAQVACGVAGLALWMLAGIKPGWWS
jgi:hypothetical protein